MPCLLIATTVSPGAKKEKIRLQHPETDLRIVIRFVFLQSI